MPTKHAILDKLTADELSAIASSRALLVSDKPSNAELVDAVARSKLTSIASILSGYSRARLKTLCRDLGISDAGKEKADLIARITGSRAEAGSDGNEGLPDAPSINSSSGPQIAAAPDANQNITSIGAPSPGTAVAGQGANQNVTNVNLHVPSHAVPNSTISTVVPASDIKSRLENHIVWIVGGVAVTALGIGFSVGYKFEHSKHEAAIEAIRHHTEAILEVCGVPPSERPDAPARQIDTIKQRCLRTPVPSGSSTPTQSTPSATVVPSLPGCSVGPPIPKAGSGAGNYFVDVARATTMNVKKETVLSVASGAHRLLGVYWKGNPPWAATKIMPLPQLGPQPLIVARWDGLSRADAAALCDYLKCEHWWPGQDGDIIKICEYDQRPKP